VSLASEYYEPIIWELEDKIKRLEKANADWFDDYWAKVAEKQTLEAALRMAKEHCEGRAGSPKWRDTLRVIDAALSGAAPPRCDRCDGRGSIGACHTPGVGTEFFPCPACQTTK
jgi:hypothetical protein